MRSGSSCSAAAAASRVSPSLIGAAAPCTVGEAFAIAQHNCEAWQRSSLLERTVLADRVAANLCKHRAEFIDAECARRGLDPAAASPKQLFDLELMHLSLAHYLCWMRQLFKISKFEEKYDIEPLVDNKLRVTLQLPASIGLFIKTQHQLILADGPTTVAVGSAEEAIYHGIKGEPWLMEEIRRAEDAETVRGSESKVAAWLPKLPYVQIQLIFGSKKKVLPVELQPAALQCSRPPPPGVTVILGAGNVGTYTDILGSIFIEQQAVIYKPHTISAGAPVDVFFKVFQPLLEAGVLRVVLGGAETAQQLIRDPRSTKWVHTGHASVALKILYGGRPPPPRDADFATFAKALACSKTFCTELGGNSPAIIAPSVLWSSREITATAEHIAFHALLNGGHICTRPSTIVICRQWPQREEFILALKKALRESGDQVPHWYPGTDRKIAEFREAVAADGRDPDAYRLEPELYFYDDAPHDSKVLQQEFFCHALVEIALDVPEASAAAFLPKAVDFCNRKLVGNLAGGIFCKNTAAGAGKLAACVCEKAVDEAVQSLQCGVVAVNIWPTQLNGVPWCAWRGFPGATAIDSLVSGVGSLGNIFRFRRVLKTVERSQWMSLSFRLQTVNNETLDRRRAVARSALHFACTSSLLPLLKLGKASIFL